MKRGSYPSDLSEGQCQRIEFLLPAAKTGGRPAKHGRLAIRGKQRRFSKDYEYLPSTSETVIYIAMIGLMIRRLARK